MPLADRLVVTRVHLQPDGDTSFPVIDPDVWREAERNARAAGADDEARFTLVVYERRAAGAAAGRH
jgi:dihydrofolate reductase